MKEILTSIVLGIILGFSICAFLRSNLALELAREAGKLSLQNAKSYDVEEKPEPQSTYTKDLYINGEKVDCSNDTHIRNYSGSYPKGTHMYEIDPGLSVGDTADYTIKNGSNKRVRVVITPMGEE